jgi:hypothetical protein
MMVPVGRNSMRAEELAAEFGIGFLDFVERDTGRTRRRSRPTVGLSNLAVVSVMRRCGRSGAPVGSDKIVPRPFLKPGAMRVFSMLSATRVIAGRRRRALA